MLYYEKELNKSCVDIYYLYNYCMARSYKKMIMEYQLTEGVKGQGILDQQGEEYGRQKMKETVTACWSIQGLRSKVQITNFRDTSK
jgi:hypothetical protein